MISTTELLDIKSRLITAGKAARLIANSADPVFMDQEQYEAVYAALNSMSQDISRILAELDVLRGMFYSGVSLFLAEEVGRNGNGVPVTGGDVGGVPAPKAGPGGEGEPQVSQGADGGVPTRRVPGKRTKRSKSRRDPSGDGVLPVQVGSGDGAVEVDRSADA